MRLYALRSAAVLGITALAATAPANAQEPIVLGAGTAEWDARTPAHEDAPDDAPANSAELLRLWAESDAEYLYLAFEVAEPVLLSRDNALRIAIDADAEATTGEPVHGLGAELVWRFGALRGDVYLDGYHGEWEAAGLGLMTAPQVTATRFELALPRGEVPYVVPLLTGDSIRVALLGSVGGDALPDEPGGVLVALSDSPRARPPVSLAKADPAHVRVLAYNVLRDRLFDPTYGAAYERVFRAVRPDIVIGVEVYDHGGAEAAARVAALLGEPAADWHGAAAGTDIVVAARYPVSPVASVRGNGVFTVEAPGGERDWLVVGMHPPCCTNDAGRQLDVDAMMAYLRDARESGALAEGTPIVIGGDMNFVGDAQQRQTLLTGDIVDEAQFGPDFDPDWDGTALEDARPLTTGFPAAFTWRNVREPFPPGRLDYIVHTDAVLERGHAFVLYTPGMTEEERASLGLEAHDAAGIEYGFDNEPYPSDHLPLVADFYEPEIVRAALPADRAPGLRLLDLVPHPLRGAGTLLFRLGAAGHVEAALFDVLGRRVRVLADEHRSAGDHALPLDGATLAPGLYLVRVTSGGRTVTRTLTALR